MTSDEICIYVQELHGLDNYFDGDLEERIEQCSHYELEIIEIKYLDEQWSVNSEVSKEYSELDSSIPAIVVIEIGNNTYDIIDGSHRIEAAKLNNQTKIKAYVGRL